MSRQVDDRKMSSCASLFFYISALTLVFFQLGAAHEPNALCSNETNVEDRSCSTQIMDGNDDSCVVRYFPTNSSLCKEMEFGPIVENSKLGEVTLEPYIYTYWQNPFELNFTVLNITFSNIHWNSMKFRFERNGTILKNHCRNIEIARSISVSSQSVLYYDCWWSNQKDIYVGENYILDFRAEGDAGVKRGQYYFTVPNVTQLSPTVALDQWTPFIYIEIGAESLILHVKPAPPSLGIVKYQIEVVKEGPEGRDTVRQKTLVTTTGEVTYEYSYLHQSGSYYFWVTPIHKDHLKDPSVVCQKVKSPTIVISNDHPATAVCIASITSVVVATLFAYYIVLRLIRRYCCKDYKLASEEDALSTPPKVLIIYQPTNKLHTECVTSFVNFLRYECGLHVMYDADIGGTAHGDPYVWCKEALNVANYVLYIVGPPEELNRKEDKSALTANCDVDKLLLSLIKACRLETNKHFLNVIFEHSKGPIPVEMINDKTFYLLKDWNKLICYLTKNVLAKQQLMRTEKGRCLYDDLRRAKKHFVQKCQFDDVVIKCDHVELGGVDKKTLL